MYITDELYGKYSFWCTSWGEHLEHSKGVIFTNSALWANSFYKSKCPSVCLSVSVCLFTFWGTLGKISGKKWSQIWTFLLKNGLKSPGRKKFFFKDLKKKLLIFEVMFKRIFAPTSQSRMSKMFRDSESLGKINGKKWSQMWTFLLKNGPTSPRRRKKNYGYFFLFHSI